MAIPIRFDSIRSDGVGFHRVIKDFMVSDRTQKRTGERARLIVATLCRAFNCALTHRRIVCRSCGVCRCRAAIRRVRAAAAAASTASPSRMRSRQSSSTLERASCQWRTQEKTRSVSGGWHTAPPLRQRRRHQSLCFAQRLLAMPLLVRDFASIRLSPERFAVLPDAGPDVPSRRQTHHFRFGTHDARSHRPARQHSAAAMTRR